MLIKSTRPHDLKESQVTDEQLFRNRRKFIRQGVQAGLGLSLASYFPQLAMASIGKFRDRIAESPTTYPNDEESNTLEEITGYNNFYELGTGKDDPAKFADALQTDPWSVTVEGECAKPGVYTLEDLLDPMEFEERIYRFRCVERWSMVIPWNGFQLSKLLNRFEPSGNAKYVAFETIYDPANPLPGQRRPVISWPYREGLRMDEAMHPLSFIAVGVYGKALPNQNGAPMRLVVPWKYGYKSIKSIVKISFTDRRPPTSWGLLAPKEYGFFSNVNPNRRHPRWSQARERRIGEFFQRETLMFNGYDEVASLYEGMDLIKNH